MVGIGISWFTTNLKWWFKSVFGGMKKKAKEDYLRCKSKLSEIEKNKELLPTEREIGDDYYDFWERAIPVTTIQKLELFFVICFISAIITLYYLFSQPNILSEAFGILIDVLKGLFGMLFGFGFPSLRSSSPQTIMFIMSSTIFLFSLVMILWELREIQKAPLYEEGNEEIADRWLNLIGERERRKIPLWLLIILIVVTVVEAFVVTTIVSGVVSDEITIGTTYIIGFFISLGLAALLHWISFLGGVELYKVSFAKKLLNRMRTEALLEGADTLNENIDLAYKSSLYKELVELEEAISLKKSKTRKSPKTSHHISDLLDLAKKSFIGKLGEYKFFIASLIFVILIGTCVFLFRIQAVEALVDSMKPPIKVEAVESSTTSTKTSVTYSEEDDGVLKDIYDKKAVETEKKQGFIAVTLLFVIFLLLYVSTVYSGYVYSYSNPKSEEFAKILKYSFEIGKWRNRVKNTADKYFIKYYSKFLDVVQEELSRSFKREPFSFEEYVKLKKKNENLKRG